MYSAEINAQDKEYLVHAEAPGYADVWRKISVDDQEDSKLNVPTIDMRKVHELREVDVVATRIKMCWKGDTIVYNADAFTLPDGSVLEDVLKAMPGMEVNSNGEIKVNGRKVDVLQLDGKDFLKGGTEMLLKNLPHYTVDQVKVFEQDELDARLVGAHSAEKEYTLNVTLKKQYKIGWLGNIELAGGLPTGKQKNLSPSGEPERGP